MLDRRAPLQMAVFGRLPSEPQYLIEPARKYRDIQYGEQLANFAQAITPEQLQDLTRIADCYRNNDHEIALQKLLDEYPIDEDEDSARLYFLFWVIDGLGIPIHRPDWNSVGSHVAALQRFGSYRLASERAHAAKFLADFGSDAKPAIPSLETACSDEDARVRVWAHFALAVIAGERDANTSAIREIFSQHNSQNADGFYDEVGMEAEAALENLEDLSL